MKLIKKVSSIFKRSTNNTLNNHSFYKLSQTCQIRGLEMLYGRHLGEIKNGVFVEVGAFDGEYSSNTSGLADLGWTGYYIEPVLSYYEMCKNRHITNKNIKVDNVAIGAQECKTKINIAGPLSSIDSRTMAQFRKLEWSKNLVTDNFIEVQQTTLDSYLTTNRISNGFHLLVIDVEGYEWEVLKTFDINMWQPKMVIIELHDQNKDYAYLEKECGEIVLYFEKNNYRVVYKDFTNTVYVRESC